MVIKKLKIKFILTNLVLISIVIIIAFMLIYFNAKRELKDNSSLAMHDIAEMNYGGLEYLFDPEERNDSKYSYLSTYVIELNERSNTCYISGFGDVENLSEEQLNYVSSLIVAVQMQDNEEGVLDEYNLRYLTVKTPFGQRIVLLDKRYEDDSLRKLITVFLISGSLGLAAFFIISLIVSNIAIKPVERSMKLQQQLISDVSHELKTPISVISTNTDIILSHSDSTIDKERKWLGYIKDEAARMSDMVSMMLYLAKTDEAGTKPQLTDLDLSNAAFETALPFESYCFENKRVLNIDIEPGINIIGDEASIKQLIVILLDNAVKYSNDNGKIELKIRAVDDKAVLSVFNTGNPIPKEDIPHLFDRFYRIDESRSRSKGGSGLGLSIAKRIIENNEAAISVASSQANGTIFTCTFKILKQNKKDDNNKNPQFI